MARNSQVDTKIRKVIYFKIAYAQHVLLMQTHKQTDSFKYQVLGYWFSQVLLYSSNIGSPTFQTLNKYFIQNKTTYIS